MDKIRVTISWLDTNLTHKSWRCRFFSNCLSNDILCQRSCILARSLMEVTSRKWTTFSISIREGSRYQIGWIFWKNSKRPLTPPLIFGIFFYHGYGCIYARRYKGQIAWNACTAHAFFKVCHVLILSCYAFFHSCSCSLVFLGMIASDSHSRFVGMDFFIPFPFPYFGNRFFHSLPISKFWECFFYSLPVPEFREWVFPFPSVPELREWNYPFPFPFPKFQMSFPPTPGSEYP